MPEQESSGEPVAFCAALTTVWDALGRHAPTRDEILRQLTPRQREELHAALADARDRQNR